MLESSPSEDSGPVFPEFSIVISFECIASALHLSVAGWSCAIGKLSDSICLNKSFTDSVAIFKMLACVCKSLRHFLRFIISLRQFLAKSTLYIFPKFIHFFLAHWIWFNQLHSWSAHSNCNTLYVAQKILAKLPTCCSIFSEYPLQFRKVLYDLVSLFFTPRDLRICSWWYLFCSLMNSLFDYVCRVYSRLRLECADAFFDFSWHRRHSMKGSGRDSRSSSNARSMHPTFEIAVPARCSAICTRHWATESPIGHTTHCGLGNLGHEWKNKWRREKAVFGSRVNAYWPMPCNLPWTMRCAVNDAVSLISILDYWELPWTDPGFPVSDGCDIFKSWSPISEYYSKTVGVLENLSIP